MPSQRLTIEEKDDRNDGYVLPNVSGNDESSRVIEVLAWQETRLSAVLTPSTIPNSSNGPFIRAKKATQI